MLRAEAIENEIMPELAEVDLARRLWDVAIGERVVEVIVPKPHARVFRGTDVAAMQAGLAGQRVAASEASGKQMVFRFGVKADRWLGIHLGMEGDLRVEASRFEPRKHDYLILRQAKRSLVYHDTRLFGRVLFHRGPDVPEWWAKLPPSIFSEAFTRDAVAEFLLRRKGTALKPLLLMQERFPGVGNWMADEILWRAKLHPSRRAGELSPAEITRLHRTVREVCRLAIEQIGRDWGYPETWLFGHRWEKGGACPRCGVDLDRAQIGGRTTCWCPRCQPR
jgi:formamidopyrimidine-DNA glycosylase